MTYGFQIKVTAYTTWPCWWWHKELLRQIESHQSCSIGDGWILFYWILIDFMFICILLARFHWTKQLYSISCTRTTYLNIFVKYHIRKPRLLQKQLVKHRPIHEPKPSLVRMQVVPLYSSSCVDLKRRIVFVLIRQHQIFAVRSRMLWYSAYVRHDFPPYTLALSHYWHYQYFINVVCFRRVSQRQGTK